MKFAKNIKSPHIKLHLKTPPQQICAKRMTRASVYFINRHNDDVNLNPC